MALGSFSATRRSGRPLPRPKHYSLDAKGARCSVESHLFRSHLVPHVEWSVYTWSSRSVASLCVCLFTTLRPFTLKLSVSHARGLLNRVLSVLRPHSFFLFLRSENQAVGEVAKHVSHVYMNSNRLIVLNRAAFKRQNLFQIRLLPFSVACWIRLISIEMPLAGWCSCAPREEWRSRAQSRRLQGDSGFLTRPPSPVTQCGIAFESTASLKVSFNTGLPGQSTSDSRYRFGFMRTISIVREKRNDMMPAVTLALVELRRKIG